jgi:hypothetical protein
VILEFEMKLLSERHLGANARGTLYTATTDNFLRSLQEGTV